MTDGTTTSAMQVAQLIYAAVKDLVLLHTKDFSGMPLKSVIIEINGQPKRDHKSALADHVTTDYNLKWDHMHFDILTTCRSDNVK